MGIISGIRRTFQKVLAALRVNRGDINRNDRAGALCRAWGHIVSNQIRGNYLEFGVFRGESLAESYLQWRQFEQWIRLQISEKQDPWRQEVWGEYSTFSPVFYGFDTFSGMPDNDEREKAFSPGTFATGETLVRNRCQAAGLRAPQLVLKSGLFSDMKEHDIEGQAAIINLDSDLYLSARDALKVAKHHMQQGMVLLMDDYNTFRASNSEGERRALREFSEATGIVFEPWFSYHFVGQAFVCHMDQYATGNRDRVRPSLGNQHA